MTGSAAAAQRLRRLGDLKRIALVAHDHRKQDLLEWATFNRTVLAEHALYATATTGALLRGELKALLRIALVWNIPVACNRASADFNISSPLLAEAYQRRLPDHESLVALG